MAHLGVGSPCQHINALKVVELDNDFSSCARLGGGAGRTRTNHQSVMEHGWCPTNYPGRTPFRIAGRFAVLLDFPGFLILDQPPKRYGTWLVSDQLPWSDTLEPTTKVLWNMGVSDQPTSSDTQLRQGNPGSEY